MASTLSKTCPPKYSESSFLNLILNPCKILLKFPANDYQFVNQPGHLENAFAVKLDDAIVSFSTFYRQPFLHFQTLILTDNQKYLIRISVTILLKIFFYENTSVNSFTKRTCFRI